MTSKNKKQEIFEEAAKLFQEKGYGAASMRDLADRVQLKASSLYSHIRKKEEILQRFAATRPTVLRRRWGGRTNESERGKKKSKPSFPSTSAPHWKTQLPSPCSAMNGNTWKNPT
ncbi:MAG: helix-turn-helix transcriptional regulator [Saprospirales bacterium]|nr:helix-turn-helix transcriptional regulator [Saprospirales bacterium]